MSHINLATLKAELINDPTGIYGQNVALGNISLVADAINLPRAGITIRRADISSADIVNAISIADYTVLPNNPNTGALSTERRFLSWMECIASTDRVKLLESDGTDSPTIANFKSMFANGTGTLTRLLALATRIGSRAEFLFGNDITIDQDHILQALAL